MAAGNEPVQIVCPGELPIKVLKWKVKRDSIVMKGAVLALYEVQSKSLFTDFRPRVWKRSEEVKLKLKSPASGIVENILVDVGTTTEPGTVLIMLKQEKFGGCTHPTVMKDMCADCGADLRREPGISGDYKEAMSASVAMVHNIPELIVSQEQAVQLGQEDQQRLLKTRKLVLLVDLDQTLIHTTNDNIPPLMKDVHHFQLWQGPQTPWYHTKFRPHISTFLEHVSEMYELHICTFGVRLYAHTVARLIDPDEKYFSHRILSRDECFDPMSKTANLKALFPCGDAMVCIIDDREDVWNMAPNLVHVKPYHFFQGTADINAPPGLGKTENDEIPFAHTVVQQHNYRCTDMKDKCLHQHQKNKIPDCQHIPNEDRNKNSGNMPEIVHQNTSVFDQEKTPADVPGNDSTDSRTSLEKTRSKFSDKVSCENKTVVFENISTEDETSENVIKTLTERTASDSKLSSDTVGKQSEKTQEQGVDDVHTSSVSQSKVLNDSDIAHLDSNNKVELKAMADNHKNSSDRGENLKETVGESVDTELGMSVSAAEMMKDTASEKEIKNNPVNNNLNELEKSAFEEENVKALARENCMEVAWDDQDDYLLHLEDILTRIHQAFYSMVDEGQHLANTSLPDLKSLIPYVKQKILKGCNIVFSGLIPVNGAAEKSRAYIVAKELGATVQQRIIAAKPGAKTRQVTTHLVAAKPGTNKHKTAVKIKGLHIVHSSWLWTCEERWEHCDEQLFPLSSSENSDLVNDPKLQSNKLVQQKRKTRVREVEEKKSGVSKSHSPKRQKTSITLHTDGEDSSSQDNLHQQLDVERSDSSSKETGSSFAETLHPLLSFSDEDIECMDKEVDEIMAEEETGSEDESDEERNVRYRTTVLGHVSDSGSSSDSLSGEFPRGWRLRHKSSEDDLEKQQQKETELETEDTENELYHFQKTVETFSPDSESCVSSAESIGSVDDEIAEAVEKELLSSL